MSYTTPAISEFKTQFVRDFPYGFGTQNVQDADIQSGMNAAVSNINPNLFSSQTEYSYNFLLLSAHYMVLNLRASGAQNQGLAGQWSWLQQSKGVGSVSESLSIPEQMTKNPLYQAYSKTTYGALFLMNVYPKLAGQCFAVAGATYP